MKNAVEQMSKGLIDDAPEVEVRTVEVEGLVAAVVGGQIVLNVGKTAGLKVGDQLSIERITQEIKDPGTGKVIRRGMQGWRRSQDGDAVAQADAAAGVSPRSILWAGRRNFRRAFAPPRASW